MRRLQNLLDQNKQWSSSIRKKQPDYFEKLSRQQAPEYLWIGCSDSRVPANQITDLMPGDLFVHRNVANQVIHTDLNCLSVIQYAVDYLKVKHIIVCGHYGCGGVAEATKNSKLGMIDNWLRHVQDIKHRHKHVLESEPSEHNLINRMCELNVVEQVVNVCQTTIVQDAWGRGQELSVHSWIYGLKDGLLRDLGMCVTAPDELEALYNDSVAAIVDKISNSVEIE